MKSHLLLLLFLPMFAISQVKIATNNPNIPYLYKVGFKDFEVKPSLLTVDSLYYVNELRFNHTLWATNSGAILYNKFGKWHRHVEQTNNRNPILIWENIKLFDDSDELFTVCAFGEESRQTIYTSVMVQDSNNNDCLKEMSPSKEKVISYFVTEMNKDKDLKKFSKTYWKMRGKSR